MFATEAENAKNNNMQNIERNFGGFMEMSVFMLVLI